MTLNLIKALAIDDDRSCLAVYQKVLAARGYDVCACQDAESALAAWREQGPFSLVLVDWMMPGMQGPEFCRALRGLADGGQAFILMTTARDEPEGLEHALMSGVDDYIFKPVSVPFLNLRIEIAEHQIIERRKRAEAETAMRESEDKYRGLVERANDGICIIQDGRVAYANARLCEILDYEHATVQQQPFLAFAHPDGLAALNGKCDLISDGLDQEVYETLLADGAGAAVAVEINAGKIAYLNRPASLVLVRHIGDRKKAEQEHLEREKFKSILEVAGTVCHELNQPMQVVLGYAEMILMNAPRDLPHYHQLQVMKEQAERMARITAKLSRISHYVKQDYADGLSIIDLEKATAEPARTRK